MKYSILKPKKVNLEKLEKTYSPDFKFSFDKAYLIIYLIIKFGNKKDNKRKVELSSTMLQSLIGRDYNKYIAFLLENYFGHGNILNGYRYSKNHSFSYKITEYFLSDGFELYELTDYKLINKYKSIFLKNNTNEQIRRHYYFLLKHFNANKLKVFEPYNAIQSTNSLEPKKRLKNALNLIDFMNGEYNISLRTKTDGRVHSNLTRLSKKSRKFLQFKEEPLAEIDISSAVPFLIFLIINFYLSNNLSYLNKFIYNNSNLFIYMLDEVTGDIDKYELEEFGKSIKSKEIYKRFEEQMFNQDLYQSKGIEYNKVIKYYQHHFKIKYGHYFDEDLIDLKDFPKIRFLSMLFAPTHTYKFEQLIFKEMFPTIYKFINEYKDVIQYKDSEEMKISKKDSHKKLAYLCFQMEAKIMIDNIAFEFDKKNKGKVPIYTLHDCLLTTSSHAEELKEFMNNKFLELFGIAPNLTLEYFNTNKLLKKAS